MSQILVDDIINRSEGSVGFSKGITIGAGTSINQSASNTLALGTNDETRIQIESDGVTHISNNTGDSLHWNSYNCHLLHTDATDFTTLVENSHDSNPNVLGLHMSDAAPNNGSSMYLQCYDTSGGTTTVRAKITSDGTLTGTSFVKSGGTSSLYLMADGSTSTGGGGGGGISAVVDDTSPQLGGNLDLNSKDITGTGNIDITGQLDVSGISTFSSTVGFGTTVGFGATVYINDLGIFHDGNSVNYIKDLGNRLEVNAGTFFVGVGSTAITDYQIIVTEVPAVVPNIGGDKYPALYYYDASAQQTTVRLTTQNYGVSVNGISSATSFVKTGGTASQYLMADGTTSTGGGGGITVGKSIMMSMIFG